MLQKRSFPRRPAALFTAAAILLSLSGCGRLGEDSPMIDLSEQSVPVDFTAPAETAAASAYRYKTNSGEISLLLKSENALDDSAITIELWKKGGFSRTQAKESLLSSEETATCFSGLDSNTVYYFKYINNDQHDQKIIGTITDGNGQTGESAFALVDTAGNVPSSDHNCDDLGDDGSMQMQASLEGGTEYCSDRLLRTNTEQMVVSNPSDIDLTICLYIVTDSRKEAGSIMELAANSSATFTNLSSSQRYHIGITAEEAADVTITVSAR